MEKRDFNLMSGCEAKELSKLIDEMEYFEFEEGFELHVAGTSGYWFHMVSHGQVEWRLDFEFNGERVPYLCTGRMSAEHVRLMTRRNDMESSRRHAVVTKTPCGLWALSMERVFQITAKSLAKMKTEILSLFDSLPQFKELPPDHKELVAQCSYLMPLQPGGCLSLNGMPWSRGPGSAACGRMFLMSGAARVEGGGGFGTGDCYLSGAMFDSRMRCRITAHAVGECRILMVRYPEKDVRGGFVAGILEERFKLQLRDLQRVSFLGSGQFGSVHLVQHKQSGLRYAVKTLKKGRKSKRVQRQVANECEALTRAQDSFVQKFIQTMETPEDMLITTEFLPGGDLFDTVRQFPKALTREAAVFYIGCLMLALKSLHARLIVHRDLKPENVMLDARGYLKLIDFGTSKQLSNLEEKAYTIVGSWSFMAPEIISGNGYGFAVDYWALGVILFELVCCRLPFDDDDPEEIKRQVRESDPDFPIKYKDELGISLITGLLKKNPAERLSCEEIMNHAYFGGDHTIFSALQQGIVEPPLKGLAKLTDAGG